jgi:3-deoxy-D-manno-octulosonic-acid transferase
MGRLHHAGWLLYQGAYAAMLLLAAPALAAKRGLSHYLATVRGRLARALPEPPPAPGSFWIHAVSVGEAGVAATLARQLPLSLPLCVTTITPTGQAQARRLFAGRASVGYLPFDFAFSVRRFYAAVSPRLLVLCEGDYWPLVLREARRRRVPVLVVNGRMSDRAFGNQRRLGRVNRLFYDSVDFFAMQTEEDRERLVSLGVDSAKVAVGGNLKFDSLPPAPKPELEAAVEALAGGRPILVAGSTLEGEEEALLAALEELGRGRLFLVLAARHPERWDAVEKLVRARGFSVLRRSRLAEAAAGDAPEVLLLDSLGELAALYRLATVAFVGGTLVPKGGHNPLEPAHFGVPILVGPSMFNFREIGERFAKAEAWRQLDKPSQLAPALRFLLGDPAAAAALGGRARALLEENRGAAARTLALIEPYIERAFGKGEPER